MEKSIREQRIRNLTHIYYSRPEVQKAIYKFCKDREISPRYFEGFGKRPDSFQYQGDIFELVKKGATSFHCSEEIWKNPLSISTDMTPEKYNEIRTGWDLILDIDSKYIDYSKIMVQEIVKVLNFHGIKNLGIKFSVAGETPILIENNNQISLMPISEVISLIKKGNKIKVLSLDREKKLKLSKIYNFLEHKDTLYEIKHTQSTLPLKVTKHHSVFIWDKGNILEKKVSELKKGDFLISFNTQKNPLASPNLKTINKFEFSKNQHSKKIIYKEIKITKKLMRLIGYFLAEGHTTDTINQVGFTFNVNEKEYIEDVIELLTLLTKRKISIRHPNPNSTQILIHSKEWSTFFNNFCGKKKNKHVPSFSWESSRELFLEMLKGYIRGDGYKIGEYGIVVKSVSKKLITEMIWLCKLNNISCNLSWEQNKPHTLPQGTFFKGSLVYMLRIPKSELKNLEFHRKRNKFSPYAGDRTFPIDGLKEVYKQIKPKMFNSHRVEQMTLSKKEANLKRIRKVLDWFYKFKEVESNKDSKEILSNYEKLFNLDIVTIKIKEITKKEKAMVYDVSVEKTESFFGNYYPLLLHNSGSKGFHIIIPWKSFPKEVNGIKTKNMFPEWPRILLQYISKKTEPFLIKEITKLTTINKYIKDFEAPKEVVPDIILVSPRHLFRTPYSLHEKTSLASVVLTPEEVANFELKDAMPMKVKIKDFIPNLEDIKEGEASELLMQALDWWKDQKPEDNKKAEGKFANFKPLQLTNIKENQFPPCIINILNGIRDGKKRALFTLIHFFRSIGTDKVELEKKIEKWNKKNIPPLKQGYITSQLSWAYKRKPLMPANCKEFYQGIAVCTSDNLCKQIKNPVNYIVRKNFAENKNSKKKKVENKKDKKKTVPKNKNK